MTNPFIHLQHGDETLLDEDDRFGQANHLWSSNEIDALTLAWATQRPLLVRGEAGCGKSQLARAAAAVLMAKNAQVELVYEVIHPRFEALDLLYRIDTIERLADAELVHVDPAIFDRTGAKYVKHGAMWRAFDAQNQCGQSVLLIDEIDKADSDIPNALLEVMGNRSFSLPSAGESKTLKVSRLPLIVVTTNEERELPLAFLRRCVVLNQNPPKDDDREAFLSWLISRGAVHTRLTIEKKPRRWAAEQVLADRLVAKPLGLGRVGLAEYVDLLTALHDLTREASDEARESEQTQWLKRLNQYALVKGADQDQKRSPVPELVNAD